METEEEETLTADNSINQTSMKQTLTALTTPKCWKQHTMMFWYWIRCLTQLCECVCNVKPEPGTWVLNFSVHVMTLFSSLFSNIPWHYSWVSSCFFVSNAELKEALNFQKVLRCNGIKVNIIHFIWGFQSCYKKKDTSKEFKSKLSYFKWIGWLVEWLIHTVNTSKFW